MLLLVGRENARMLGEVKDKLEVRQNGSSNLTEHSLGTFDRGAYSKKENNRHAHGHGRQTSGCLNIANGDAPKWPVWFSNDRTVRRRIETAYRNRPEKLQISLDWTSTLKLMSQGPVLCTGELFPGCWESSRVSDSDIEQLAGDPTALADLPANGTPRPRVSVLNPFPQSTDWPWKEFEFLLERGLGLKKHSKGATINSATIDAAFEEGRVLFLSSSLEHAETYFNTQFFSNGPRERNMTNDSRRQYNIISLLGVIMIMRQNEVEFKQFLDMAFDVLRVCIAANMNYERMYLTCFWLWTNPFWQPIGTFLLKYRLLELALPQMNTAIRIITETVCKTLMFPMTTARTIASLYFNDLIDLFSFLDDKDGLLDVWTGLAMPDDEVPPIRVSRNRSHSTRFMWASVLKKPLNLQALRSRQLLESLP